MIDSPDRSFSLSSPSLVHPGWALLGVVLGLGLLAGCSSFSSDEKPLPDSTFADVLTELHLASVRQTTDAPYQPGLRDSIFARHDVRPSAFDATLRYYSRHPKAFESLYQSVIDTLRALRFSRRDRTIPESVPDSLYNNKRRGGRSP